MCEPQLRFHPCQYGVSRYLRASASPRETSNAVFRINALEAESRMNRLWSYLLLLTDKDFYAYRDGNGTVADICGLGEVTESGLKGEISF